MLVDFKFIVRLFKLVFLDSYLDLDLDSYLDYFFKLSFQIKILGWILFQNSDTQIVTDSMVHDGFCRDSLCGKGNRTSCYSGWCDRDE